MEKERQNIIKSIQKLIELIGPDISLNDCLGLCHSPTSNVDKILCKISEKLCHPKFTDNIRLVFPEHLLLLVSKAFPVDQCRIDGIQYQQNCIALSKLIDFSPAISKYSLQYFRKNPSPFCNDAAYSSTNQKQAKTEEQNLISDLEIVKCCYRFLRNNFSYYKNIWKWSNFLQIYVNKGCNLQCLYCNKILALLLNMNETQLKHLNRNIPEKMLLQIESTDAPNALDCTRNKSVSPSDWEMNFVSDVVINIEGVLLPIHDKQNFKYYQNTDGPFERIIRVESTKINLRSLAVGVSAGKAICLTGPVGCGKTTLVECLARKTGRIDIKKPVQHSENKNESKESGNEISKNGKNKKRKAIEEHNGKERDSIEIPKNSFLRIQLGDQTDSKMLLGQYHCTDVPGEFVWQPGVLTQAVMNGSWLLLEDLDSATQDVITVLTNLLENNYLSVPGFRDYIRISPGFQLFTTLRNQKSSNHTKHSAFQLIEKYLYIINVLPLSRNELCQVISENYPKLSTIAGRIVDVYLMFSSGCHDQTTYQTMANDEQRDEEKISTIGLSNSNRLVSTRDLLKLCRRSDPTFSITSAECAYFVFENAVDLFCSYLPQGNIKTQLITKIGGYLGIIKSRCEFLADDFKPETTLNEGQIKIGRAKLDRYDQDYGKRRSVMDDESNKIKKKVKTNDGNSQNIYQKSIAKLPTFSFTRVSACILERIAVAVVQNEPILLVGETGVGKTSSVQYLAHQLNHKLIVVNMNNQSDVSDLVGGFKPVDLIYVLAPLRFEFEYLFKLTFNAAKNEQFLNNISIQFNRANFKILILLMLKIADKVFERKANDQLENIKSESILNRWQSLKLKLLKLNSQLQNSINISFSFIPGSLVNCIKNGDWVLLDEINLASVETLECLSTILEPDGSIVLLERGDYAPIKRHPNFRIFACMNPNTDIGKKDLPVGIRNRFTEFFVDELTSENDLLILINDYLSNTGIKKAKVSAIAKLYRKLRTLAMLDLNDGLGNRPVYSLRTLCRSLIICGRNLCGSIERNLYESLCLSFLTQLDPDSHRLVQQLIQKSMLTDAKAILSQSIPQHNRNQINFEGYWIDRGSKEIQECENYILTQSVRLNLKDLSRIVSIGKLPVLLQGPTSAGKTSLIEYVARKSGNHCLRINNHEHTDLQEYIGTYTADVTGKLVFKEGVLVQAMKNGYWIILDELNLAPSDILEALNRVLDDNRELFIPETQVLVKAHPNFMLFATQNPPGLYGGRKTLSRAFKNRFIELHFSEIPKDELEIILEKRCQIPKSFSKKMVKTMSELQINRKNATKSSFTLRDLFRWGNRYTFADKTLLENNAYDWNQHLVEEGYLALSAKIRNEYEVEMIETVLFTNFRKKVNMETLFFLNEKTSMVTKNILEKVSNHPKYDNIVWTFNMRRMAILTAKALEFDEPVLLVGPTGCGKTTVCQILAEVSKKNLRILNCHMHTEGADFLGGLRPFRGSTTENGQKQLFEWANGPIIYSMIEGSYFLADEISLAEDSVLERLNCILEPERTVLLAEKGGLNEDFLMESETENFSEFQIKASNGFQFLATMNPGGDFGKKELSPALRNRFTEIWCRSTESKDDLCKIASHSLMLGLGNPAKKELMDNLANILIEIIYFLKENVEKFSFSIRDILAWIEYITINTNGKNILGLPEAIVFGLETIFLDSLEMQFNCDMKQIEKCRLEALQFTIKQIQQSLNLNVSIFDIKSEKGIKVENTNDLFGISPFYIPVNLEKIHKSSDFMFTAPTTQENLFRLLSALTLNKAILLEGPPGVGKTSLIESLTKTIGFNIVRINLCEHTDLADLFGTDLPAEDTSLDVDSNANDIRQLGSFAWRDGPLLAALKTENTWILLDELNLAPQSVLEGLNAILDHRGEVYIPELNKTFKLQKQTKIFASQNPLKQGGGRKGLPQSFLNRFTKVYLKKLMTEDLLHVVQSRYKWFFNQLSQFFGIEHDDMEGESFFNANDFSKPIKFDLCHKMVEFSEKLEKGIVNLQFGYKGGPFEVNLRDIMRWCDFLSNSKTGFVMDFNIDSKQRCTDFLQILFEKMKLVYSQRMRCDADRNFINETFGETFCCNSNRLEELSQDISLYWTDDCLYLNDIELKKNDILSDNCLSVMQCKPDAPILLKSQREILKYLSECIVMAKPVILCGPTDSGKTKAVDLLCSVLDNPCNVDTIDDSVTGTFQQVDFNRHLEELAESVENVFLHRLQTLILEENNLNAASILLGKWETYNRLTESDLNSTNTVAMSEELELFKKRLNSLGKVIDTLARAIKSPQIGNAKIKLEILRKLTANAETLNTGGHFEWVDSMIVKSLKIGQFICLEHVNLCSSAILDRLNSVFEPNGRLLLSEKGVTSTDESEIVEQHHNFRAFLTLDPKNGEISRAMRNRCIELSFNRESYTEDDLRQMIYQNGVQNVNLINCLLNIHHRLQGISDFSTFGVSHILKCAFLTAENRRIGCSDSESIYNSTLEVYVRGTNVDLLGFGLGFYRQKLENEILDEIKLIENSNAQLRYENIILKSNNLNRLAMIKLQCEPFLTIVQGLSNEHQDIQLYLRYLLQGFETIDFEISEKFLNCLLYFLYEICSVDDVNLRMMYIEAEIQKLPGATQLNENLVTLNRRLCDIVKSSTNKNNWSKSGLPWNPKIFSRLRTYKNQPQNINNQLKLSLQLIASILLERIAIQNSTKLNQIDVVSYSKAVQTKMITDSINNPFLNSVHPMMEKLREIIEKVLSDAENLNFNIYVNLMCAYLWNNRFLKISQQKVFNGKKLNDKLIDTLMLHFKWMDKYLLKILRDISTTKSTSHQIDLDKNFLQMKNHLITVDHPLNSLRKNFMKNLTSFPPFYDQKQCLEYEAIHSFQNLISLVANLGEFSEEDLTKRFKLIASNRCNEMKLKLAKITANEMDSIENISLENCLMDKKSIEINQYDEGIWKEMEDFKEFCNEENKIEITSLKLIIELLPMLEFFALKSLNPVQANKSHKLNYEYFERINSVGVEELQIISTINSDSYKNYECRWFHVMDNIKLEFFHIQKQITNLKQICEEPNYVYKVASSIHSNLMRKLQSYFLKSISINSHICYGNKKSNDLVSVNGPLLTNAALNILLNEKGDLRASGLGALNIWRNSLKTISNLLWSNVELFREDFSFESSNLESSFEYAIKLLVELNLIRNNIGDSEYSKIDEDFQNLVTELQNSTKKLHSFMYDFDDKSSNQLKNKSIQEGSILYSLTASIELNLLPYMPILDPVEKNYLKKTYIEEDMIHLEHLLTAYDFMKVTMGYKNLGEDIIEHFRTKFEYLANRKEKFLKKVALRPKTCIYKEMVNDINHFLKACCQPKSLLELIKSTEEFLNEKIDYFTLNSNKDETRNYIRHIDEAVKKIDMWITNSKRFQYHTLVKYSTFYRDFLDPIENSITKLIIGFTGLKQCLIRRKNSIYAKPNGSYLNLAEGNSLEHILENLIEFPSTHGLNILPSQQALDDVSGLNTCKINMFMLLDEIDNSNLSYVLLIKSKLQEIYNQISTAASINEATFTDFDSILNIFNTLWKRQEDLRRKRIQSEQSLYVTKTHCETENEDETISREIQKIFPNYVEEDFGEFIQADTLEQVRTNKISNANKNEQTEDILTQNDYAFICEIFLDTLDKFSSSYYHKINATERFNANIDFRQSFETKIKIFRQLFNEHKTYLNSRMDGCAFNSLGLLTGILQENYGMVQLKDDSPTSYNFYKDSNITEILNSTEVLSKLEVRVSKELEQWPDHAVLNDIIRIIERIRSLPSTSSVVRFSSGFQILRQKVDEWNSVAHKHNHFKDLEYEIAGYIQRWTKLELQCWRECLTQSFKKIQSKAFKYWFFIYNLLHEYLNGSSGAPCKLSDYRNVEKYFGQDEPILDAEESSDTLKTSDVVEVVKQFIESANFGDYSLRMRILKGFEQYLHYVPVKNAKRKNNLIKIFHNLWMYFEQFRLEIDEKIKSMRTPIEKKLKEFVKIESYNKDLSYFSMRNNIARVHRNLHKFLKEFETQLSSKISSVFVIKEQQNYLANVENDKGKNLRFEAKVKYYMVKVNNFLVSEKMAEQMISSPTASISNLKYLPRIKTLFLTSRNISRKAIKYSQYPSLIYSLDSLLTDQLETCDYMRNLAVDRSKERSKQKVQAKQILTQKRKALSDLFKNLSTLGISFKAGLKEVQLSQELYDYKVPPFCIRSMICDQKHKKIDTNLINLNTKLDLYFSNCVYKLKLLQTVLLTPNAELGMPNIERVKGFSVDMFLLVQNQRIHLSENIKSLSELKQQIQNIEDLDSVIQDNQNDMTNRSFLKICSELQSMKQGLCTIFNVFQQYDLLWKVIPNVSEEEQQFEPFTVLSDGKPFNSSSDRYGKVIKSSNGIINETKKILKDIEKYEQKIIQNPKNINAFKEKFESIVHCIKELYQDLCFPNGEHLVIANAIQSLLKDLKKTNKNDQHSMELTSNETNNFKENILNELENIIHSICWSMEMIYKQLGDDVLENSIDSKKSDEEEFGGQIEENHLREKLNAQLEKDFNILNIKKIVSKLSTILLNILHSNRVDDFTVYKHISGLLPLLEQYFCLSKFYLTELIGVHKVSTKMLSIMLSVFVELGTKGFCTPQDLMHDEEDNEEKNQEQKGGEGFGLEDGTGETDASDKIESEDQLDTAKKPGDDNKTDDKEDADCKEEKGIDMSEDFDSKLQDVEKRPDDSDNSDESEDEEDHDKQMGETDEGADKLDEQIWGSDEENIDEDEEEEEEMNEEENGKGSKEEGDQHNDLDQKNQTKEGENEENGLDATENSDKEKKQKEKDIDKFEDPEIGEDQVNPYHNELENPPEPEDLELGDNMNLDDGDVNEKEENEENPFDIDTMKDKMETTEVEEENQDEENPTEEKNEESKVDSDSEEEDEAGNLTKDEELTDKHEEEEETQAEADNVEQNRDEVKENNEEEDEKSNDHQEQDKEKEEYNPSKDKSSKEENIQAMPEEKNQGSTDQIQVEQSEKDTKQKEEMDVQETGEDKEGIGQAENEESKSGHQGIADTKETKSKQSQEENNHHDERKQGNTDEQRTIAESNKKNQKQLKTVQEINETPSSDDKDDKQQHDDVEMDEYQHVKEAKETDKTTLDNATEEQSKQVIHEDNAKEDEIENSEEKTNDELMETENEDTNLEHVEPIEAEELAEKSKKPSKQEKSKEKCETKEHVEVEGDFIDTATVMRGIDTSAHCSMEIVQDGTLPSEPSTMETMDMRKIFEKEMMSSKLINPDSSDFDLWQTISNKMLSSARDLCEQLRLILEPTKCTRLKGDYRTGRRINMKKIIPYIASQFRKDKIWLRRTKPAQRDYKITIAIDDSKSMHHNNSKILTLQAISLVSQALTLLESGRLSILSFGESPQIILKHSEQFDGPKLVKSMNFAQNQSRIAELLDFARTANAENSGSSSDNGIFENLLLILSDGRNIFSEGEQRVRNSVKLARLQRIFVVYIIIDNPENKHSILDIRVPSFTADSKLISMKSYLDSFPFPYYVIVRDLAQLPLVLSDAMRQWFELVNSEH